MEYNLIKQSVQTAGILLDAVSEEPLDVELTLPDYCPDIERILRCSLIPKVYMANISGDRLSVEGGACVRVMYLDSEKGCIRSYEHTAPYSHSFSLKDSPEQYALYVSAKPEYINCRALSPRRLSLHGAFSLCAKAAVRAPLDYYTYDADDDLQTDCRTVGVSELCGLCCETFGVREDIPMGSKPQAAALLSHRLTARITELKAIHNKIMLTAEGQLDLMYVSDPDQRGAECMSYVFPISRIIDCEGAESETVIDGELDVMTDDLTLGGDALDGSSVLNLDAKLCFNALCRIEKEISVITDCFSTQREIQPACSQLNCRCDTRCLRYTDIGKAQVRLDGDSIGKVIDVHCERIAVSAAVSGGAILLSSKADIGILYVTGEGETRCIERDVSFDYSPSAEEADAVESVRAAVESLSYRIVDEKTLELRAEISYRLTVSRCCGTQMITAVTADDDAPARQNDGALILYYADGGERVWDISKRFCSRPSDIISENRLEDEVLSGDVMLLIPSA